MSAALAVPKVVPKVTVTVLAEAALRVITLMVEVAGPSATVTGVVIAITDGPVLIVKVAVSHSAATAPAVGHTL
jgi:phosphoribosylcarboxyaminoimidazole (NCAIR) mutase